MYEIDPGAIARWLLAEGHSKRDVVRVMLAASAHAQRGVKILAKQTVYNWIDGGTASNWVVETKRWSRFRTALGLARRGGFDQLDRFLAQIGGRATDSRTDFEVDLARKLATGEQVRGARLRLHVEPGAIRVSNRYDGPGVSRHIDFRVEGISLVVPGYPPIEPRRYVRVSYPADPYHVSPKMGVVCLLLERASGKVVLVATVRPAVRAALVEAIRGFPRSIDANWAATAVHEVDEEVGAELVATTTATGETFTALRTGVAYVDSGKLADQVAYTIGVVERVEPESIAHDLWQPAVIRVDLGMFLRACEAGGAQDGGANLIPIEPGDILRTEATRKRYMFDQSHVAIEDSFTLLAGLLARRHIHRFIGLSEALDHAICSASVGA